MTRSMNDKLVTLAGRLLVAAILIFVMLPTIVVFISSFSSTSVLVSFLERLVAALV